MFRPRAVTITRAGRRSMSCPLVIKSQPISISAAIGGQNGIGRILKPISLVMVPDPGDLQSSGSRWTLHTAELEADSVDWAIARS